MRKPSTPRSSQKRSTSSIAARTRGCASSGRAARAGRRGSTGAASASQVQAEPPNVAAPVVRRAVRRAVVPEVRGRARVAVGEPRVLIEVWFGTKSRITLSPGGARRRRARRSRRGAEAAGRRRSSRRRRSRSRPSARGRSARARGRRRRAGEVVEPRADAGQVADAVAVGVLERARVDLVDRPAAEPADHR